MKQHVEEVLEHLAHLSHFPEIVCLCGSTRFYDAFMDENYKLTMNGCIVLSVGFFMHASGNSHGGTIGATSQQKHQLDDLHLRKIELADRVHVVNVDDYIGASTKRELWFARRHGKPITFRESSNWSNDVIDALFKSWDHWGSAAKPAAQVPHQT